MLSLVFFFFFSEISTPAVDMKKKNKSCPPLARRREMLPGFSLPLETEKETGLEMGSGGSPVCFGPLKC